MVFTLFFQHAKNKIYHKRNEYAKHPWYSVIFPLQVQKLKFNVCIKKRLKHCNLQCYRLEEAPYDKHSQDFGGKTVARRTWQRAW